MTSVHAAAQRSFDELGIPLSDTTFCVLDLETTGTNREHDLITEIGAVKVRHGECLGTFQTLVNPGRAIPPKISVLTGLTDALVSTAPRIEGVLGPFLEFIGDAVVVGHNVGFDLAFLRAAVERTGRSPFTPTVVDTVALARRLVRDEVPDCRLGTLASRFRLDHRPSHRALDDALATADLLHFLIERASGLGVLGLDDLISLSKLAGHPQAAKLQMTADLPRGPGVYMFRGSNNDLLYVGKATNLRQRVRSYFSSDSRRKIGSLLREAQSIHHLELPDPLTAEVIEQRLIATSLPRYNRTGTRVDKYCYVRLDVDAPWPRLSIAREPSGTSVHLGPLPSRSMAQLVIETIHTALPLRRCSTRLGARHVPDPRAVPCTSAQLGISACPCAGLADADRYRETVAGACKVLAGDPSSISELLVQRMASLAAQQRFEEAAMARDRMAALLGALKRHELVRALRRAGRFELTDGQITWTIDQARLVDVSVHGRVTGALPVGAPDPAPEHGPLNRHQIDEALCLARHIDRHIDRHGDRLRLQRCSGTWEFPLAVSDQVPRLDAPVPG
jgi:DNA polymerase-3 subunit epsilon